MKKKLITTFGKKITRARKLYWSLFKGIIKMEYFKMFLNEADYTLFKSKQKKRGKFENNTYYIFSQNIFN